MVGFAMVYRSCTNGEHRYGDRLAGRAVAGDLFKNQSLVLDLEATPNQVKQAKRLHLRIFTAVGIASPRRPGPILKQTADTQLRMVQVLDDHTRCCPV